MDYVCMYARSNSVPSYSLLLCIFSTPYGFIEAPYCKDSDSFDQLLLFMRSPVFTPNHGIAEYKISRVANGTSVKTSPPVPTRTSDSSQLESRR